MRNCGLAAATVLALTAMAGAQAPDTDVEWRHYGADRFSTRYSPADEIDRTNVGKLEVAWRWDAAEADAEVDGERSRSFVATPLMIGGVLYVLVGSYDATIILSVVASIAGALVLLSMEPTDKLLIPDWEESLPPELHSPVPVPATAGD